MFNFGDIILADYNFSDNSGSKLRPVLFLFSDREDYTILKMTTKQDNFDDSYTLCIDPDYENNIKASSYIKIKKIATFHESLFLPKKVGNISENQKKYIKNQLKGLFESLY